MVVLWLWIMFVDHNLYLSFHTLIISTVADLNLPKPKPRVVTPQSSSPPDSSDSAMAAPGRAQSSAEDLPAQPEPTRTSTTLRSVVPSSPAPEPIEEDIEDAPPMMR